MSARQKSALGLFVTFAILATLLGLTLGVQYAKSDTGNDPEYRGDFRGIVASGVGPGGAIIGGLLYCEPPTDDSLPMVCYFEGADAWAQATGANQVGGDIHACPGIGTRQYVIQNFAVCAGVVMGVTIDGTLTNLTEGAQWNRGLSNLEAATSLATAIETVAGVEDATVVGAGPTYPIAITLETETCSTTVATGAAPCATVINGGDGYFHVAEYISGVNENTNIRITNAGLYFRGNGNYAGQIDGGNWIMGAAHKFSWQTRSMLTSPVDGNIRLTNNAENDFGLLQFGGTTNAFPALQRNGTQLNARLADNSAYAIFNGQNYFANSNFGYGFLGDADSYFGRVGSDQLGIIVHTVNGLVVTEGEYAAGEILQKWGPCTFANLGAAANGSFCHCSDCAKATPCAGAGNGALAKRLNGAWDCD